MCRAVFLTFDTLIVLTIPLEHSTTFISCLYQFAKSCPKYNIAFWFPLIVNSSARSQIQPKLKETMYLQLALIA